LLHYKSVTRQNDLVILRIRQRDLAPQPSASIGDRQIKPFSSRPCLVYRRRRIRGNASPRFTVFSAPKSNQPVSSSLLRERSGLEAVYR